MPRDPELAAALERATRIGGRPRSQARLLRDLAIRGAAVLVEEEDRRKQLIEEFIDRTRQPGHVDPAILAFLRSEGWGRGAML